MPRSGLLIAVTFIAGRYEAVGSRRGSVQSAILRSRREAPSSLDVAVSRGSDRGLTVRVSGGDTGSGTIWLVRFDLEHTTPVCAGENKGKTLTSRNIVRQMREIGPWNGVATEITLPDFTLEANQGCAVLVQREWPHPTDRSSALPTARTADAPVQAGFAEPGLAAIDDPPMVRRGFRPASFPPFSLGLPGDSTPPSYRLKHVETLGRLITEGGRK